MSSLQSIQIDQLPRSVEEFIALRDRIAVTPQGGAAMMVLAVLSYTQDEDLGRQCLTIAIDRDRLQEGPDGYKGWQLRVRDLQLMRSQIGPQAHIPRSYIKGATPENGYELPAPPYMFEFSHDPYSGDPESGKVKVFIASSGASKPRPVTVHRNNRGIWKAAEWSSLLVGVQPPAQTPDDDL